MRLFLTLVIVGVGLTLLGFAMIFESMDGTTPDDMAFVGLALGVILGPLTVISGLVAYALRRPTPNELASQKEGNSRTWHFRPAGLLILVVGLAVIVALVNWAEQYVPNINSKRRLLFRCLFAPGCLALLSSRQVRNLIFYTGEIPKAKAAGDKSEERAVPGAAPARRGM